MAKKIEHEEKVQKKLDQWKERVKDLENSAEKAGGKAHEGIQKALKELKDQKAHIQEIFNRLKDSGGKAYEEGKKSLDSSIERFEEKSKDLRTKISLIAKRAKKKTIEIKDDISKTTLWEKIEKGFDEALESSKRPP